MTMHGALDQEKVPVPQVLEEDDEDPHAAEEVELLDRLPRGRWPGGEDGERVAIRSASPTDQLALSFVGSVLTVPMRSMSVSTAFSAVAFFV